jgi:hypothetical protein
MIRSIECRPTIQQFRSLSRIIFLDDPVTIEPPFFRLSGRLPLANHWTTIDEATIADTVPAPWATWLSVC